MIPLLLTVLAIFVVLVANEIWWHTSRVHGEVSRKFVHITVGSFVAFWPYFLSSDQIKLLSLAFILVVLISKYLGVFRAIHSVQRPTLGEVWFAVTVGVLAFSVDQHPYVYTVALLHMSLADGLAAIVGTHYGSSSRYRVLGHAKSLAGTAAFFAVSLCLLVSYAMYVPGVLPFVAIPIIALVASMLENIAVQGLDNLLVPLFVGGVLLLALAQT